MAKRFAEVMTAPGTVWDFRIPDYLIGKLDVGDLVCYPVEPGVYDIGTVVKTSAVTDHRFSNVRTLVDKIKLNRYTKYEESRHAAGLLMQNMAKRQAELEALEAYKKSAKDDAEMKELYDEYLSTAE